MALQSFNANDVVYTVSLDIDTLPGLRPWILLRAQLIDELTGSPPRGAIDIESPFSGISPRVAPGGMVGFEGIPRRAFPELANSDYYVPLTINADGYIPISFTQKISKNTAFPGTFTPTDIGVLQLHRLPTVIQGQVAVNTGTDLKADNNAAITLTGLWRTPPPANLTVPPSSPDLVSLNPGLYSDRPSAGSQVQGLKFQGAPGPDKQLLQDSSAGQTTLRLSDRVQIAAADLLAIDTGDPALTEYVAIQSIAGASTDVQPATVTLVSPLRLTHRQGAIAHKVMFQNVGAATQLTADATTGDVCIFVNGVGNLGSAPLVSVKTGGTVEYQTASYFTATSDAQGFYHFPPLSRVAQCALNAHDGTHPDLPITYSPDYSNGESRVDFIYS